MNIFCNQLKSWWIKRRVKERKARIEDLDESICKMRHDDPRRSDVRLLILDLKDRNKIDCAELTALNLEQV